MTKQEVFVDYLSVEAREVGVLRRQYHAGRWDAGGLVVSSGTRVRWEQREIGEPMPVLGSIVVLDLEPETWKVAGT